MNKDSVLYELASRKNGDINWHQGRSWSLVYYAGHEHDCFLKQAYSTYFSENGVSPAAFPSLARLEAEVISMILSLHRASGNESGTMTSGGTESILLAMKAYRDYAAAIGLSKTSPEILVPVSAHPAFLKATQYFGLRAIPVAIGSDYRAVPDDVARKITDKTICIVASAPSYPYGMVDPIPELARIATKHDIGLHVDACLGGFILPFMRRLGLQVTDFDFQVDGVTSISTDLHKNAYAAKGASAILYRTPELRSHQFFVTTEWPGGLYGSATMAGTRPGGSIAAAWAALMRLGMDGYTDLTRRALQVTHRLTEGIRNIPGLFVIGEPDMTVFSFGSQDLNIFSIADRLQSAGWSMDRQQQPDSLHMIATPNHEQSVEPFLHDLREAVADERTTPLSAKHAGQQMLYGVTTSITGNKDPSEYMRQKMGEVYDIS